MSKSGSMHVEIDGMRQLRRDLKAIDKKLPRELNKRLKVAAEPLRAEAARLAPRSGRDRPGRQHLADTLRVGTRGSRVVIYSRNPGAKVVHWGGRHPLFGDRTHWYQQKAQPFIARAAEHQAARVEHQVAQTVEGLMRNIGFR